MYKYMDLHGYTGAYARVHAYKYVYIYIYACVFMYIYTEREREREIHGDMPESSNFRSMPAVVPLCAFRSCQFMLEVVPQQDVGSGLRK